MNINVTIGERIIISLWPCAHDGGTATVTDAQDWAKSLREQRDAKRNAEAEKHRKVALQRDIVAEKMPQLWEELIAEYRNHAAAYNGELEPERTLAVHTGRNSFMVRPDAMPEIVTGKLELTTHKVEIIAGSSQFSYWPNPVLEGTGSLQLVSANAPQRVVTLAEIVRETLQAGLR
jgi:hypothetical protein